MATFKDRLARNIAEEYFGITVGRVAEAMGRKGRATLHTLQRVTGLPHPVVRSSVFILIHQHCATHATEVINGREITHYELCLDELLDRSRYPAYLRIAEEAHGKDAAYILQEIMVHGSLSLATLLEHLQSSAARTDAIRKVFNTLASSGYIRAIKAVDFLSRDDRLISAENVEVARLLGPASAKEMESIKLRVSLAQQHEDSLIVGMKRRIAEQGDDRASKRRAGDIDFVNVVEDTALFRIHSPRFQIHLRNHAIEEWIAQRISRPASVIVRTLLAIASPRVQDIKENRTPSIPLNQISQNLPPQMDLASGIVFPSDGPPPTSDRWELLLTFMEIIVTESSGVIVRADDRGASGEYTIDFYRFRRLRQEELIVRIAMERTGATGARLWRLALKRRWLDEKNVGKMALLPAKEARERLQALHSLGFLRIQEVPRTLDRAPSRTFYLWFVDMPFAVRSVTTILLRSIGNLRMRRDKEVADRGSILRRMERPDIIADPTLISQADKEACQALQKIVEKLRVAEARLALLLPLFTS